MKARAIVWTTNRERLDLTFNSRKERELYCMNREKVAAYQYVPVNKLLYKIYNLF